MRAVLEPRKPLRETQFLVCFFFFKILPLKLRDRKTASDLLTEPARTRVRLRGPARISEKKFLSVTGGRVFSFLNHPFSATIILR